MGECCAGARMVPDAEGLIQLARSGGDMPDGLRLAEIWLFQSARNLYREYQCGKLSQEAGKRERVQIMNAYRTAASTQDMWHTVLQRKRDGETAVNEYRKHPTRENADRAIDALYGGVGRRVP